MQDATGTDSGLETGEKPGRICILMGLYNGAADLPEQLASIAAQSRTDWDLIVSDDGSGDDGPRIVRDFARAMAPTGHKVTLVAGPRRGFAANFLSMVARAPKGAWLAYCDQDDVWLPERLARGVAALAALPGEVPAVYCSRTWITDHNLENRRLSVRFARRPGFRNALVQNVVAGNTALLNRAGAALARAAAAEVEAAGVSGLAAHDWWTYQLITGAGGRVIMDDEPTLLYRQHPENLIGANDGWRARMTRFSMLLGGRFAAWNQANIAALRASAPRLTPENRALLERFAAMRAGWFWPRLRGFAALRLYRQGPMGQMAMWLAVLLRKI